MNKLVSSILGWLILIASGVLFAIIADKLKVDEPMVLPLCFSLIAAMGWAYAVMHQQNYPSKVVSIVYIAEILLLIIFRDDLGGLVLTQTMSALIILGLVFMLSGPRLGQAIALSLSPIQKYLQSIGLRLSIHVIVGIVGFILACVSLVMV